MKVNAKILSIPPYISTSWKNVLSLHIETRSNHSILVIGLVNGSTIDVPNLDEASIRSVFAAHQQSLEQASSPSSSHSPILPEGLPEGGSAVLSLPFHLGLDTNMGSLLQHNQEAADSPDLPPDMIEKITQLSKAVGLDNLENFPKPEPHCNCMHCQMMRAMRDQKDEPLDQIEEEEVSEEDLKFREWDVAQTGKQLYTVSNPFNKEEQFQVHLGNPVGCTCGKPNCEHIRAVLNS